MASSHRLSGGALDRDRALSEVAQFLQEVRKQVTQHEERMERLLAGSRPPSWEGPRSAGIPVPRPEPTKPALPWGDMPQLLHADDWAEEPPQPPELPGKVSSSEPKPKGAAPRAAICRAQSAGDNARPTVAWAGNVTKPMVQARIDKIHETYVDQHPSPLSFKTLFAPWEKRKSSLRAAHRRARVVGPSKSCVARVIESPAFDTFMIFLIITSAICLGIQMEWQMRNIEKPTPLFFEAVESFFTLAFTVEILLRIANERLRFIFWSNPMFYWNVFDVSVVSWCLICKGTNFGWFSVENASFMRLIRVLRVFRTFRLMRVMNELSDVRMMVAGIVRSFWSLVWALLLLGFIMFLFSLCIMQAVHDELQQYNVMEAVLVDEKKLMYYYGSTVRTMYTLYRTISGGLEWGHAAEPLRPISTMLVIGFCLYIAFSVFCVLNVITGVFVDNATKFTQSDKDSAVQERLLWFEEVQRLFHTMDDGSGMMTLPTFHDLTADIEAQIAFSKVGIDLDGTNVDVLFRMLDFDGSGEVDINEFIAGLEMYHGSAKRMDIARLMRETKKLNRKMADILKLVEATHNIV